MADDKDTKPNDWAANRKEWEDTHTPEMGYPVAEDIPAAGQDPDTLRRNEKHAAAAGIIDADQVSDPVITNPTDGDTVNDKDKTDDQDPKADAAKARKTSAQARNTTPQGRAASPTEKA